MLPEAFKQNIQSFKHIMKKAEDFKTVDEAVAWGNQMEQERDEALLAQQEAEALADEAIAKADQVLKDAPKTYTTTLSGYGKVKVKFGVEGKTKDALLADEELLVALLKKGSNAVAVVEPEEEGK